MIKKVAFAAALMCATSVSYAGGSLMAGFIVNSEFEETESGFEDVEGDGDGFSLQGSIDINESLFAYADYYDRDLDIDLDAFGLPGEKVGAELSNFRLGLGYLLPDTPVYFGVNYERYKLGFDGESDSSDGFGLRAGARLPVSAVVSLTLEAGYVAVEDADGFDFSVGADVAINAQFSIFGDYRYLQLSLDDSDIENTLGDVRLGIRVNF